MAAVVVAAVLVAGCAERGSSSGAAPGRPPSGSADPTTSALGDGPGFTLGPLPSRPATTSPVRIPDGTDRTGCPGAATCGRFSARSPLPLVDGRIRISYRINPTGATTPYLTSGHLVAAINAGARAWQAAEPRLDFRYLGTTTEPAGSPGVAGFGTPCSHGSHPACGGRIDGEPTLTFSDTAPWIWASCGPGADDEPCTSYDQPCRRANGNLRCEGIDLQAVATHEWGHVLGLDDLFGDHTEGLTMYARSKVTEPHRDQARRELSTLGLGDVLGLRALYRSDRPVPRIAVP